MIKKFLAAGISLVIAATLITGCGAEKGTKKDTDSSTGAKVGDTGKTGGDGKYQDGIYFAKEDNFAENGWKYMATLEVKDGKIVSADWNGANIKAGDDKVTQSTNGTYGMKEKGKAQAEWQEQADKAEAYLIEKQDPAAITYTDDEGHTDAISGASIHVKEFFDLAQKALANGPVGRGQYKDGAYFAEEDAFAENGWKYNASITVVNGFIVAANWNGTHKDGGDDKDTQSANGTYGMKEKGKAQSEWHEQAAKAEAFLVEKQDPTAITYTDDEGHTDAISGASIHVKEFFDLAQKALASAK